MSAFDPKRTLVLRIFVRQNGRYLGRMTMPHRANGPVVISLICLAGLFVGGRPATAEVTRIEVTSKQLYGTFRAGE